MAVVGVVAFARKCLDFVRLDEVVTEKLRRLKATPVLWVVKYRTRSADAE
jgi:hypothetical protein